MTRPKMKPCPECGGDVAAWTYESGWRRVECFDCDYIATPAGNLLHAIQHHNANSSAGKDPHDHP